MNLIEGIRLHPAGIGEVETDVVFGEGGHGGVFVGGIHFHPGVAFLLLPLRCVAGGEEEDALALEAGQVDLETAVVGLRLADDVVLRVFGIYELGVYGHVLLDGSFLHVATGSLVHLGLAVLAVGVCGFETENVVVCIVPFRALQLERGEGAGGAEEAGLHPVLIVRV